MVGLDCCLLSVRLLLVLVCVFRLSSCCGLVVVVGGLVCVVSVTRGFWGCDALFRVFVLWRFWLF